MEVSQTGFDYTSSLFVQYIRTTLMASSLPDKGQRLTLTVFGETQQFLVEKIEPMTLPEGSRYAVT